MTCNTLKNIQKPLGVSDQSVFMLQYHGFEIDYWTHGYYIVRVHMQEIGLGELLHAVWMYLESIYHVPAQCDSFTLSTLQLVISEWSEVDRPLLWRSEDINLNVWKEIEKNVGWEPTTQILINIYIISGLFLNRTIQHATRREYQ